jgi:hypothetical protein
MRRGRLVSGRVAAKANLAPDGIVAGVWKAATLVTGMMMAAVQIQAQQMHPQIPCPVLLVSGHAGRDSIQLSFINKGKVPIQTEPCMLAPDAGKGAGLHLS